jgi:nucleoside-diphosphate-sugar epimerase
VLSGRKILITGASGMVAAPIAESLARDNEVWGLARYADPAARARVAAAGVIPLQADLARADLSAVPGDFDYVLHFAHTRLGPGDFVPAIEVNAVGAGHVLAHCRKARAALVVSSSAVYSPHPDPYHLFREEEDIGQGRTPWAPTSAVSKVSLEAVARFCAEAFELPTVIARLNTVYGPRGGMPVMDMDAIAAGRSAAWFADPYPHSPIHADDMCAQIEPLLDAASRPATLVNWCGDEVVTQREWCEQAAAWLGKQARIEITPVPGTPSGGAHDPTRRRALTGPCKLEFRRSLTDLLRARYPQEAR